MLGLAAPKKSDDAQEIRWLHKHHFFSGQSLRPFFKGKRIHYKKWTVICWQKAMFDFIHEEKSETNSLPLKNGGWETILSFWKTYIQIQTRCWFGQQIPCMLFNQKIQQKKTGNKKNGFCLPFFHRQPFSLPPKKEVNLTYPFCLEEHPQHPASCVASSRSWHCHGGLTLDTDPWITLDFLMAEISNNHLGCMKPYK